MTTYEPQPANSAEISVATFPLSGQQKLLWDINDQHRYQLLLAIKNGHKAEQVKQAITVLLQRHSALTHQYVPSPGVKYPAQFSGQNANDSMYWNELDIDASRLADLTTLAKQVTGLFTWLRVPSEKPSDTEAESCYLLISVPALSCDMASLLVLVTELEQLLNKQPLPELEADYEQFVNWQASCLEEDNEDYQQAKSLWLDEKEGIATPLQNRRKRSEYIDKNTESKTINSSRERLSSTLCQKLQNWAEQQSVTLQTVISAATLFTLHTFSQSERIIVNQHFACRPFEELDELVGCLAKPLPMLSQMYKNDSFAALCRRIEKQSDALEENAEYFPESTKMAANNVTATTVAELSHNILETSLQSLTVEAISGLLIPGQQTRQAQVPLTFSFTELVMNDDDSEILVSVESCQQQYSGDATSDLLNRILAVLEQLSYTPSLMVSDIDLLLPQDKTLYKNAQGKSQADNPQTVIERFNDFALRYPDRAAVTDEKRQLSYGEVNHYANQLASQLIEYKTTDSADTALVPLYLTRSVWSLVSMLACFKAGMAFVPLEADDLVQQGQALPARAASLLAIINPKVVLTDQVHQQELRSAGYDCLVTDRETIASDVHFEAQSHRANDLAYVIYTSGTTGEPKGVMVTQQNLSNYCASLLSNLGEVLKHNPQDTDIAQAQFACVSTLAADLGYTAVFGAISSGACLHLMSYNTITSEQDYANYLQNHHIDLVKMVPSHLQALLNSADISGTPAHTLLPKKALILGGETFTLPLHKTLKQLQAERELSCQIFNHYGPSETTIGCFMVAINQLQQAPNPDNSGLDFSDSLPIGKPMLNTGFRIVDENGKDALPFMPGELVVSGAGVCSGYLNASDEEQQRFTQKNIDGISQRAFHTKDKVRLLPDGCVEFLGRIDTQVKLRGYRIELDAIRHQILQHPAVSQVYVNLFQTKGQSNGNEGEPRLVAWYVENTQLATDTEQQKIYKGYAHVDNLASVDNGAKGLEKAVIAFLKQHLPDYMLPTQWIKLQRLPLTLNGKIDSKALPDADESLNQQKSFLPPQSELEKQLATIWSDLLKVEKCSLNDNFFELGGNSLLATQVVARLRKLTETEIAIADLFDHPVLQDQAACLEGLVNATQTIAGKTSVDDKQIRPPQLTVVDPTQCYPLSFAQQRLWFLDQLNPGSSFYNVPAAIRFRGELDEQQVLNALQAVWNCHDGLRIRISKSDNSTTPQQTIAQQPLTISKTDLTQVDGGSFNVNANREKAAQLCALEAQTPFDLHQDPLMRAHLIKITDDEHLLLVTLHHIISDAWSTDLLLQEFTNAYLGQTLARPAFNSLDFSHWQQQFFTAEREQQELDFWQQALQGAQQYIPLPLDRQRPEYQTWRGARLHSRIDTNTMQSLDKLAKDSRTSRFMLLITAFNLMLNQQTRATDLSVTVPIAGRNPEGAEDSMERCIGLFLNSLIVRAQLDKAVTVRQLAEQIREHLLAAFEHQSLPFDRLIRHLPINRATGYTPFNQVCFNLLNTPLGKSLETMNSDSLTAQLEISDTCTAKYDMEWILAEQEDEVALCVEYNADLFAPETIEAMVKDFNHWLSQLSERFDHSWAEPDIALNTEQASVLLNNQSTLSQITAPSFSCRLPKLTATRLQAQQQWQLDGEQQAWLENYCEEHQLAPEHWLGSLAALSLRLYVEGSDDYMARLDNKALVVAGCDLAKDVEVVELLKQICIQAASPLVATTPDCLEGLSALDIVYMDDFLRNDSQHNAGQQQSPRLLLINKAPQWQLNLENKEQNLPGLLSVMSNIVQQLMVCEGLTVKQLSWLNPQQCQTVIQQLTGPKPTPVAHKDNPLLSALEKGLTHNPSAIAVRDAQGTVTYEALHAQANQLAHQLLAAQVPDTGSNTTPIVALMIQPGHRWITLMLASIKAGYMYLPLDAQLPQERIAKILQDADCQYLWYDTDYQGKIEQLQQILKKQTVTVNMQAWPDLLIGAAQYPTTAPQPKDVANKALYAIYTSGSTGEPKGAMVSHANARNLLDWYLAEYQISADDKVLIISSLGFDLTQKNLFATLSAGAQLVFPDMQHFDADVVRDTIAQQQVSLLNCAPSAFYSVLSVCDNNAAESRFQALSSLRYLLLGGESIDLARLQPWLSAEGCHTRLVNMYGPTECTDIACAYTMEPGEWHKHEDISQCILPIGFANAGVQLYVLDEQQRLLPPGVVGELAITGAGVGKGYINRPELNAKAFQTNPLIASETSSDHERLYLTGDRVYVNAQGALVFCGRRDHQVKHRGFRIELSGIRGAILQLDKVAEAAVLLTPDQRQQKQLVAIIKPKASTQNNIHTKDEQQHLLNELKAALQQDLPPYMLPERWLIQQDMPLNRNGKLDLTALANTVSNQSRQQQGPSPKTEREIWLAQLWQSLLSVETVSREDDFFVAGGHSLLATQLVSRMRKETGLDIPLTLIFEHTELASMAAAIDKLQPQQSTNSATSAPVISPVATLSDNAGCEMRFPLSYAQQRLWFVQNLNPNSSDYNMSSVLKVSGKVNTDALDQACRQLMARHTTLRTRFVQDEDNGAYQQVAQVPSQFLSTYKMDGAFSSEEIFVNQADVHIKHITDKPFDLSQSPMWRAGLISACEDLHLLVITLHHIAADGWSMALLIRELLFFYQQASGNLPSETAGLPVLPIQYVDYASWQQASLQGQWLQDLRSYWQTQLSGAPTEMPLNSDRPRSTEIDAKGARFNCEIPAELGAKVRQLAQREGVTLYMVLMAGFNVVLHHHTKQNDLVIGTDLANRSRQELENLIGFFVNVLPVRTKLNGNPGFKQLLQRVKDTTLGAYAHQDLPFDKLVEAVNPPRNPLYHPLFQVLFVLQNTPIEKLDNSGINIEVVARKQEQLRFDLALLLEESHSEEQQGSINGHWSYNTGLFDASTIEKLNGSLLQVLDAAVRDSALPLNQLLRQTNNDTQSSDGRRQKRRARIGSLKAGSSGKASLKNQA